MSGHVDPSKEKKAALLRAEALMTDSPVPSISTELLATADGELNRELYNFLFEDRDKKCYNRCKYIFLTQTRMGFLFEVLH